MTELLVALCAVFLVAWLKALDGTLSEADVEKTFSAIKAQMTRK